VKGERDLGTGLTVIEVNLVVKEIVMNHVQIDEVKEVIDPKGVKEVREVNEKNEKEVDLRINVLLDVRRKNVDTVRVLIRTLIHLPYLKLNEEKKLDGML
jgi:hypothetical protein